MGSTDLSTPEKPWTEPFLQALSETGNVSKAAQIAGIARDTPYKRLTVDQSFATAWEEALEVATDSMELEARRRALEGVRKPVFHKGVICGHVREYSDTLMIFLLKAHRPGKYRENSRGESDQVLNLDIRQLAIVLDSLGYHRRPDSGRTIEIEPRGVCSNGEHGQVGNGAPLGPFEQEGDASDPGYRAPEEPETPDHDAPPSWQE